MFLHPSLPIHCLIYSLWCIYTLIFHQFINVAVRDLEFSAIGTGLPSR